MRLKILVVAAAIALCCAADVQAGADFGLNIDWNKFENIDGGDLGVGARVDFGGQLRGIISFDWYFVGAEDLFTEDELGGNDFDLKFWEINGNVVYQFPTEAVHPYLGGGAGLARRQFNDEIFDDFFDDSQTEFGWNLLAGLKFGDYIQPFVEFRGTFYSGDETFNDRFVISGGILF